MSKDNLQTSNESIQDYIKELRKKQVEGEKQIEKEETELKKVQAKIIQYKEKEISIKNSLAKKKAIMSSYIKTIKETEGAFMKILENSKTLLHVIKRENQTVIDKDTIFAE
jgi:Sjoegren syndrome nuclear autoantigen 1